MIDYAQLVARLQRLETVFGGNDKRTPPRPIAHLVPHLGSGWGYENLQFFVIDDSTRDMVLPVVVLVGANYTQRVSSSAPLLPCSSTTTLFTRPFVEEHDTTGLFRGFRTKLQNLKHANHPVAPGTDFHLVFTNLVPWITNDPWGILTPLDKQLLLMNTLAVPAPIVYITALACAVGDAIWVGHTADLRDTLAALLKTLDVSPRYTARNLTSPLPPAFRIVP